MATKPVKFFHSGMAGAPVLNGAAGSLISVLDACLVSGFNLITLDSLVVADGVLTGSKSGHGFVVDQVIATSAAESSLQGEWSITEVTSSTFKAVADGVANVVGSGSLTAKAASSGWEKAFSATNKAVYRPLDTGTGCLLRVSDAQSYFSRVTGYESMSDIDTGVGAFPSDAQVSGGAYWPKSYNDTTTSRPWLIVSDGRMFYYLVSYTSSQNLHVGVCFGDFVSYRAADGYSCALNGWNAAPSSTPRSSIGYGFGRNPYEQQFWAARGNSQVGGSTVGSLLSMIGWAGFTGGENYCNSGASVNYLSYPSPVDSGLLLSKPYYMDGASGSGNIIRGEMTGIYHLLQASPLSHLDRVDGVAGLGARKVLISNLHNNGSYLGRVAFDITGPWR